jgi:hypothetical protein
MKILNTAKVSIKKDILAKRIQETFSVRSVFLAAMKYAIVESREAVKESSTKKCPTFPMNRCSCIV